ncbi:MAG: S24 family peptidase [Gammaproteobacteria bacterium]
MKLSDVRPRLRATHRSQADLARHLALDPSSLVKVLAGTRRVTPMEASQIEEFFGERLEVGALAPHRRERTAPRGIPVYGYAAAGNNDRIAYADDRVLDYLDPPPFWSGAGDLIYVRLVGDSMEPRYFSGEIVPVRIDWPPAKGQDCLIVFKDGTAVVKTFMGRRDGKVFALQYNERQEIPFEATAVESIHTVWKPGQI